MCVVSGSDGYCVVSGHDRYSVVFVRLRRSLKVVLAELHNSL